MGKESKTKKSEHDGPLKGPLSAQARTQALYKHQCIHCRGWVPCVPESLEAWPNTCSSPSSDANGFASSGGQQLDTLEASSAVYANEEELAASGEDDEWRDAFSNDAGNQSSG